MNNFKESSKIVVANEVEFDSMIDIDGNNITDENKNVIIGEILSWNYIEVESTGSLGDGLDFVKLKGVSQLFSPDYFQEYVQDDESNSGSYSETRALEILREKESSKMIKDTAPLIGGARKVKDAYKTISIEDLFKLGDNDVAIRDIITKERVFPKIDVQFEKDNGSTSGATFLKVNIQKSLPSKPIINTSLGRKAYVLFLENLKNALLVSKTVSTVEMAVKAVQNMFIFQMYNLVNPDKANEIAFEIASRKERLDALDGKIAVYESERQNTNSIEERARLYKLIQDIKYSDEYETSKIDYVSSDERFLLSEIYKGSSQYYSRSRANEVILKYLIGEKNIKKLNDLDIILAGKYQGLGDEAVDKMIKVYRDRIDALKKEGGEGEEKLKIYEAYLNQTSDGYVGERMPLLDVQKALIMNPSSGYVYYVGNPINNRPLKLPRGFNTSRKGYFSEREVHQFIERFGVPVIDGVDILRIVIERAIGYIRKKVNSVVGEDADSIKSIEKSIAEYEGYREESWAWWEGDKSSNSDKENGNQSKGNKSRINRGSIDGIPTINTGTPLSFIKRTGGLKIDEDNFKTIDKYVSFYDKYLGMNRIQFGLSLKDNERVQYMKHFAGSMLDLFEVLNMDIVHLNKIGDLGIQFASAGKGRAMAHYSPSSVSINLTKSKGDGTVAHEVAHYLDNLFCNIGKTIGNWNTDKYMTNIMSSSYYDNNVGYLGGNLNLYVIQYLKFLSSGKIDNSVILDENAMRVIRENGYMDRDSESIFEFIFVARQIDETFRKDSIEHIEKIAQLLGENASFTRNNFTKRDDGSFEMNKLEEYNDSFIQNCLTLLTYGKYGKSNAVSSYNYSTDSFDLRNESTIQKNKDVYLNIENGISIFGRDSFSYKVKAKRTQFYSWASLMDSGKSKQYWSSSVELFARSFETYILTRLNEKNMVNNFLVSSQWYDSGAYPQGNERVIVNAFLDKIFFEVKSLLKIPDFSCDITDRVDEYIELKGNSIIAESGVTINDKTGSVDNLEGKAKKELKAIESKINKLVKSLKNK